MKVLIWAKYTFTVPPSSAEHRSFIKERRESLHPPRHTVSYRARWHDEKDTLYCSLNHVSVLKIDNHGSRLGKVNMRITAFWNMTPCILVDMYQSLRETGVSAFRVRKFGTYAPQNTHWRWRQKFSSKLVTTNPEGCKPFFPTITTSNFIVVLFSFPGPH